MKHIIINTRTIRSKGLTSDVKQKHKKTTNRTMMSPTTDNANIRLSHLNTTYHITLIIPSGFTHFSQVIGKQYRHKIRCHRMGLHYITKTCLYNSDPLKPHFYIVKLGFAGVYIIFLISAQNIDCGYF